MSYDYPYQQHTSNYQPSQQGVPERRKKRRSARKMMAWAVVVVIGVILAGIIFWGATRVYDAFFGTRDSLEYKAAIVAGLGKHMRLPEGEPEIYNIEDPAAYIAQNAAFKDAQKGDALVIFRAAGQALIYSEQDDRIVTILAPRVE